MLAQTEYVIRHKDSDKHRGDRITDKLQQRIQRAVFRHIQFSDGFHQHQANRQQNGKQRCAQRRQGVFGAHFKIRKLCRYGLERQTITQKL
ncbi:hypothetical protein NGUA15_01592 [Salmonella enterica]|nr:hypothetical protein NGUA15_01592 [Salmonella enterica]